MTDRRRLFAFPFSCVTLLSGFVPILVSAQQQDQSATGNACDSLCITPTRSIAFETTQGTQVNLDISPDGQTILFDLLGDLYTVPRDGGSSTQLTSGMALDLQPVFSLSLIHI